MPRSMVRLSAGRAEMSDELQALCFLAGANSIFYGEKLLTTGNPDVEHDQALFARLGIRPLEVEIEPGTVHADIVECHDDCATAVDDTGVGSGRDDRVAAAHESAAA
jgi:biotin synthase